MDSQHSNAFTINSLSGSPFPFSAEFRENDTLLSLSIYPIQIRSISDIVEKHSLAFCVVFDVDHYWMNKEDRTMTLTEVAEEQEISFKSEDKEIIVCKKSELGNLLKDDFSHYNWETFDCADEPDSELILRNYVAIKDHDWKKEGFLLSKLKDAGFYLYSHDDCYLSIETVNKHFLDQVLQRNLQIYAATILAERNLIIEVKDFPLTFLDKILTEKRVITILQENSFIESNNLIIPFSNIPFHFTEAREYSISGKIVFNFINKIWSIED